MKIICIQDPIYRSERNIGYAMEDAYKKAMRYKNTHTVGLLVMPWNNCEAP